MDTNHFITHSLREARILRILSAALTAVEPGALLRRVLVDQPVANIKRTFGLAIGKAAVPMMEALSGLHPLDDGLAITKHAPAPTDGLFTVIEGGHPVPDARSLAAGERALEFVSRLQADDLLVCLISGGGSALAIAPWQGIELQDLQTLTSALLSCGARIDEINTLRRQLDRLKGGGLLRVVNKARVISLILSDVIGNPLEAIASGPTAPDPTSRQDAIEIIKKYGLDQIVPAAALSSLNSGRETLKAGDPIFDGVKNVIIGDNSMAAQAALSQAEEQGFDSRILTTALQGEARQVGRALAQTLRDASRDQPRPFCWIAGGETTVTLRGSGRGGRNQELALAAVPGLAGLDHVMLIALATDGEDGPTDAAGAVVTGESARRAESLGLDAADHLSRNDAYSFFEPLGDLLKPGYTGTNVNDLVFLIGQ
jgi:glycerate 2-kinase